LSDLVVKSSTAFLRCRDSRLSFFSRECALSTAKLSSAKTARGTGCFGTSRRNFSNRFFLRGGQIHDSEHPGIQHWCIHAAICLEENFPESCLLLCIQDTVNSCPHFGVTLLHCCGSTCACGSTPLTKTGELTAATTLTALTTLSALPWTENFIQSRCLGFREGQHSDDFRVAEECGGTGSTARLTHHALSTSLTGGTLPSCWGLSKGIEGNDIEGQCKDGNYANRNPKGTFHHFVLLYVG